MLRFQGTRMVALGLDRLFNRESNILALAGYCGFEMERVSFELTGDSAEQYFV